MAQTGEILFTTTPVQTTDLTTTWSNPANVIGNDGSFDIDVLASTSFTHQIGDTTK